MLTTQQVKRVKVLLVIFLLGGGGYFALNYSAYQKAKKTDFHWTSSDGTALVYQPAKDEAYVEIREFFLPGTKVWKPDFSLPKSGSWNSFFIDRYLKIPSPDSLYARAKIEEMGSNVNGLLKLAFAEERLSPFAMDAIIRMSMGDAKAKGSLEVMLKTNDQPRVRLLAIKGLARVNNVTFDTDEQYVNWYQQIILPNASRLKDGQ